MIYVVGLCLAAKLVTRRLHRKNVKMTLDHIGMRPIKHVRITEHDATAVIKVVR